MPSNPTLLGKFDAGGNINPVVISSVSPTGGALIVLFPGRKSGSGTPRTITGVSSTFSIDGTWTEITEDNRESSAIGAWYAIAASTPGTGDIEMTWSGGGGNPTALAYEITDYDSVEQFISGSSLTTSPLELTFASVPSGSSLILASVVEEDSLEQSVHITPSAGFTELNEITSSASVLWQQAQYENGASGSTVGWSGFNGDANIGIAIEITAVGAVGSITLNAPTAGASFGAGANVFTQATVTLGGKTVSTVYRYVDGVQDDQMTHVGSNVYEVDTPVG